MLEKLKSFLAEDAYFYSLLVVLVALVSFGLGQKSTLTDIASRNEVGVLTATPTALVPNREAATEADAAAAVVASKSGTKYHLPTCPGAKQIKESNIIEFSSTQAAEAAGYTPAANCTF